MILQARNLTAQFLKYRVDARKSLPESGNRFGEAGPLLGDAVAGTSHDIELGKDPNSVAPPPPHWVVRAEKIRTEFTVVKDRMQKLKEAHTKALVVTFNSENESQSHVEALTGNIQQAFKRLDSEIKSIYGGKSSYGLSSEDLAVQSQVQQQLAQALLKLSIDFRQEQKRYLSNVEAQKGIAAGSSLQALGLEDDPEKIARLDPGFTQEQVAKVDISLAVALERDEQITRIVETISELATIMRDLSTMVVEQGTMLDRIDKNIEKVAGDIAEGVKEVQKAETTQKTGRMMMCIIAMIVIIVILFILVLIRHG